MIRWIVLFLWFVGIPVYNEGVVHKFPTEPMCIASTINRETTFLNDVDSRAALDVILYRMQRYNKNACEIVLEKHAFSGQTKKQIEQMDRKLLTSYWNLVMMPPVAHDAEFFYSGEAPRYTRGMRVVLKTKMHIYLRRK